MLEFDICFRDMNPEDGGITERVLATAKDLKAAMWIKAALETHWYSTEDVVVDDREFFVQEREVITDEIDG